MTMNTKPHPEQLPVNGAKRVSGNKMNVSSWMRFLPRHHRLTVLALSSVAVMGLSGCASSSGLMSPMSAAQQNAVEQACGSRPVSTLRGSANSHLMFYRLCRQRVLEDES